MLPWSVVPIGIWDQEKAVRGSSELTLLWWLCGSWQSCCLSWFPFRKVFEKWILAWGHWYASSIIGCWELGMWHIAHCVESKTLLTAYLSELPYLQNHSNTNAVLSCMHYTGPLSMSRGDSGKSVDILIMSMICCLDTSLKSNMKSILFVLLVIPANRDCINQAWYQVSRW